MATTKSHSLGTSLETRGRRSSRTERKSGHWNWTKQRHRRSRVCGKNTKNSEREGDKWRYLKVGKIPPYKGWLVTWSTRSLQQNTRYIQKYTREYSNISLIVFTRDLKQLLRIYTTNSATRFTWFPALTSSNPLNQLANRSEKRKKKSQGLDEEKRQGYYVIIKGLDVWLIYVRLCWFDRGSRVALLILGFWADFWNRLCIFLVIVA